MRVPVGLVHAEADLVLFASSLRTFERRTVRAVPISLFALLVSACATGTERAAATPAAFADADSTFAIAVAPGVRHLFAQYERGPWAIHVLEIDARRCRPVLQARKPGPDLHARATTSQIAGAALGAINADFFMLPRGTLVGAHVSGGVPLTGPTDRVVFADTDSGWHIGVARMDGHARVSEDTAAIVQVNRTSARTSAYRGTAAGLTLFTAWIGDSMPADTGAHRVILRVLEGNEAAGRGVVVASDSPAAVTPVDRGTAVLLAHGAAGAWARRRGAGDTVSWSARVVLDAPAREVVGGFPELLRNGQPVLSGQTVSASFGAARHPRTAIGWTPDRRLLFVAVDGRQPPWSDGMSLDELTWLFQRLGATEAINLDGGGSTAMVVSGRLVNRTSDREGERAVGNALALAGCR